VDDDDDDDGMTRGNEKVGAKVLSGIKVQAGRNVF
jgi:hypothetical protein